MVFRGLHLEDVGNDGINLNISDQSGEEEFLENVRLDRSERGKAEEEPRESGLAVFRSPVSGLTTAAIVLQLVNGFVAEHLDLAGRVDSHLV